MAIFYQQRLVDYCQVLHWLVYTKQRRKGASSAATKTLAIYTWLRKARKQQKSEIDRTGVSIFEEGQPLHQMYTGVPAQSQVVAECQELNTGPLPPSDPSTIYHVDGRLSVPPDVLIWLSSWVLVWFKWQRLKNIGLVTGPGGLFATRLVTESGGLATNPPCNKPTEDYSQYSTKRPATRVCNRGPVTKVIQ